MSDEKKLDKIQETLELILWEIRNKKAQELEDNSTDDELFEKAKEVAKSAGKASPAILQRRLKIGYARAARLMDMMEDEGFIEEADGAKPRKLLNQK